MKKTYAFLKKIINNLELLKEVLQSRAFVRRALDNRAWLDGAVEHRDAVIPAIADREIVKRALARRNEVIAVLDQTFGPGDLDMLKEVFRLKSYVAQTLENRYWLAGALKHKDEVMTFLDQRRGQEAARGAFGKEFDQFVALAGPTPRLQIRYEDLNPQLSDRAEFTPIDRHYTYHPAWAARVLAKTRPERHIDISSIVNFSTVLSAFIPVEFYDLRPAPVKLDGFLTGAIDLTNLHFPDNSVSSLSCMHVIEHIGLGRYGDPLDPDGDLKAIGELVRVLEPGGNLLVATPVGRARVEFNAHRVYDHEKFAGYFAPLELVEFTLIEEHGDGGLIVAPPPEQVRAESYGCGCFWFRKPATERH